MTARIYTPDATGRCTVCGRPEAEHARSGGFVGDEARCMPDAAPACARCRSSLSFVRSDAAGTIFQCLTERCREYGLGVAVEPGVTAETVTDEQIVEHGNRCTLSGDAEGRETAQIAMGDLPGFSPLYRARCRGLVAAAINARAKGGR